MDQSFIHLENITLEGLKFSKNAQALQRTNIPPKQIQMKVTAEVLRDTLIIQSRCEVAILKDENQDDFEMEFTYVISASVSDPSQKELLERFGKFGAAFNALVYGRDLVRSITARAFGQAALIPLLDIQQLGKSISIVWPETQPPSQTPPITPAE